MVRLFAAYSRRYLLRRFHAIRILRSGQPPRGLSRPLVVYLNHASWWDPLVCLLISRDFFSAKTAFAPIDAESLRKYAFFTYIGIYAIERHSVRGAMKFLRTTVALLSCEDTVVWLTPQGRFMDVRERPLRLERGIGALARQSPEAAFVPLAIEYTFWTEPRPEILVSFGSPVIPGKAVLRGVAEWTEHFSLALEAAQDELAAHSCCRKPDDWLLIDKGATGVSSVYDTWRFLRARLRGKEFVREHQPEKPN